MIKECTSEDDFHQLVETSKKQPVFLFKHSSTCPISAGAWERFTEFSKTENAPQYWRLLVRENKTISDVIAQKTDIRHHTPQVILFHDGQAVWYSSHRSITADNMRRQLTRFKF
jgi:bacillithiol system protein YtxJ